MKSAYEIALERLEQRGIEKPRSQALTDEARADVAEIRAKARAELAQLEIMHRDRLAKQADPGARDEEEQNYLSERGRIESRRDRAIEKLRGA
jgi:hypothetical protein